CLQRILRRRWMAGSWASGSDAVLQTAMPGHDGCGRRGNAKARPVAALIRFAAVIADRAACKQRAMRLRRLVLLLEELRRALFQFGRRDVLHVGADEPAVAGRVLHAAAAFAVELIRRLH